MAEHTCPSGLRLELRAIKGKELKHFEDRQAIKDGTVLDLVLDACVLKVLDPGPYSLSVGEDGEIDKPDWKTILLGDEFSIFVAVRMLTFGDEYPFKVKCPQKKCRHRFEWAEKLSERPVRKLAALSAESVRTGALLTSEIAGGIKFRLLTGADERDMFKANKAENPLVSNLALSIVELAGEKDRSRIRRALEEADLGVLQDIRKKMDESDCGVETQIEIECPECETTWETNLPLGPGFLLAKSG